MEQGKPLRLQTKGADRAAGWLLVGIIGLFWLFLCWLVLVALPAFFRFSITKPEDFLAALCGLGIVVGLIFFLTLLLMGALHSALAVYEFTLQGVSKRSPFREQRANWSEVAGWAMTESDSVWWLLNKKGRVLLSLDWYTLPDTEVPTAKAFVVDALRRHLLPFSSTAQPLLSRLQRFRLLCLLAALLCNLGYGGYWLARRAGQDFVAMTVAIAMLPGIMLGGIMLGGASIFSVLGRAKFLVCGDWLIQPSGVTIHLPSVRHFERVSDGIILVGADRQAISIPSHLTFLWDYLRTHLPSELSG